MPELFHSCLQLKHTLAFFQLVLYDLLLLLHQSLQEFSQFCSLSLLLLQRLFTFFKLLRLMRKIHAELLALLVCFFKLFLETLYLFFQLLNGLSGFCKIFVYFIIDLAAIFNIVLCCLQILLISFDALRKVCIL